MIRMFLTAASIVVGMTVVCEDGAQARVPSGEPAVVVADQ